MPDLLLEFFSEEIPARMQAKAADDLRKMVTDRLVDAGLAYEGARAFVTPRRLALSVHGIPAKQPDIREEKKGPRVGAPEQAIAGFLKAAGLASIKDAKVQPDKKGDFYVAVIEKPGRTAIDVIAEIVPDVVRGFPWPKSMRWGAQSERQGSLSWVRPLHSIVATFGPETEEPDIVQFSVDGVAAGDETRGHRFMAPGPIKVRHFGDYAAKLAAAKVVLDPARRRDIILADAKNLAFAQGCELVEDEGLLAEVAGLVEWPVVLMGSFDKPFLSIPEEVIRATIRNNQKCFVLRSSSTSPLVGEVGAQRRVGGNRDDVQSPPPPTPPHKGEGRLAAKFILVANEEASDGGRAIVAGNERVIRARLADAKFFYETDLKRRLEDRLPKFGSIIFHEKLGTQGQRIERIKRLAVELAPLVGADAKKAERAAELCKADLLTEVVGEFPELQGLMGRYYAEAQGEDEVVAHAIEDHYKPKGPDDLVPADPVSVAVALADKIDTLVGFWAIDEKPTGSKDPYALRRAALGVIRIVLENELRIRLSVLYANALLSLIFRSVNIEKEVIKILAGKDIAYYEWYGLAREKPVSRILNYDGIMDAAFDLVETNDPISISHQQFKSTLEVVRGRAEALQRVLDARGTEDALRELLPAFRSFWESRLAFDADRLKVQLREQGARHDLVDAVFALEGQDDLLLIVRRVEALGKFLDTDDGKNLLAGYKRATNIIRIEEKKDKREYTGAPDPKLYQLSEEKALADAIASAKKDASAAVAHEDFAAAMTAMAKLRPKVDAFFDKVTVNVDDQRLRENRLKLLNEIREATRAVADFSRIEG